MTNLNAPQFTKNYLNIWQIKMNAALSNLRKPCSTCGRNLYKESYADLENKLCVNCNDFYKEMYKKSDLSSDGISYSDFVSGVKIAERLESF